MKIVFLDIDGVLQPYDSMNNFYELDKKLIDRLSQEYEIDFSQYNIYDVMATYYDWHKQAVARLKYVLDESDAKLIISSDWRNQKQPLKIHDLLKIHALDKYWYADNDINNSSLSNVEKRASEIQKSLETYPIDDYVVLDDMKDLKEYFPNNFVQSDNYLSVSNMQDCVKILSKKR